MEITFGKIHETILLTLALEEKNSSFLIVIGKWYFKFLESSQEKLSLQIPKYEEESINLVYNYLRLFSLIYRLLHKSTICDFEDTCLFNVFDFNKKKNSFNGFESTFNFERQEGEFLIWSNNIVTSKNRFIPVFINKQIENLNWIDTYTTFKLFKSIENKNLINHPILINIEEDLCLSLSTGNQIKPEEIILFETTNCDSKIRTDTDAIEYEEFLYTKDLSHQITIKYPYHKNIHSHFCDIGRKSFDLIFNSRFYYQKINHDDIILLPREIYQEKLYSNDIFSRFTIIDTNHEYKLFEVLKDFKSVWNGYEFNRFTTPFPKYWLMFINQSISKNEWFEMFKFDYPDLAEKPIINQIKIIIDLIYDLNWSKQFISEIKDPVILLPEIKGIGKKRLEKSLNSFKNYLSTNNPDTIFVEDDENFNYKKYKNLLLLDGFNIINVVNIIEQNDNLEILIPDFIYFAYQPWIKYHILNYQFDCLVNSKRELIDENFNLNRNTFLKQKKNLIEDIKSDIINYNRKYNKDEADFENIEITIHSQDIIFKNEEEVEVGFNVEEKFNDKELLILTTKNVKYKVKSSNQVLLQRNSIISCRASQLKVQDSFICMSEVRNSIYKDAIVNKLSRLPDSVVYFQIELSKSIDVYRILEKLGLEYRNEKYFNDKYVIKEEIYTREKFILPKRKYHWKIICDYLGISTNDMYQAWISHYGSKQINEIKNIYKQILNLCIEKDYLSEIENPKLINEIAEYLETKKSIFEDDEETNIVDLAKSIMSSIINELSFHEIKEIIIV